MTRRLGRRLARSIEIGAGRCGLDAAASASMSRGLGGPLASLPVGCDIDTGAGRCCFLRNERPGGARNLSDGPRGGDLSGEALACRFLEGVPLENNDILGQPVIEVDSFWAGGCDRDSSDPGAVRWACSVCLSIVFGEVFSSMTALCL